MGANMAARPVGVTKSKSIEAVPMRFSAKYQGSGQMVDSPCEPNSWWTAGGQNMGLNFLHQPQAASLSH